MRFKLASRFAGALILIAATPVFAQEAEEPRRTRIGLGVQIVPSYPGADDFNLRPLVDVARAKGENPFEFEAPDESFGFSLLRVGQLQIGPVLNFEGSRTGGDVGVALPKVGLTVEAGMFAQYFLSESLRVRSEIRKGLGGHEGWIGNIGADFVARRGDDWLLSAGPRVTIADDDYNSAYFSVTPEDSTRVGMPAYSADGGVQSVGATLGYLQQLTSRWGSTATPSMTAWLGMRPIRQSFGVMVQEISSQAGSRSPIHSATPGDRPHAVS